MDEIIDYEAGQQAYEQTQVLLQENALIQSASQELQEQKEGQHRFAQLARKYLPQLRSVRYFIEDAAWLIREILEETTLPFSELEVDPGLDSYTGEPLEEELCVKSHSEQLQADLRETIGNAMFLQSHKVYPKEPSLNARIVQEATLLGYDPGLALKASEFDIFDDEQDDWESMYLNAEEQLPSVPLLQNEQQEYRVHPSILVECRNDLKVFIDQIKRKKQEVIYSCKQDGRVNWQEAAALFNQWYQQTLRGDFLAAMNQLAFVYEPQYLALIFMGLEHEVIGLPLSESARIHLPGWGDLETFIELFGNEILDELVDPAPGGRQTSWPLLARLGSMIEEEIIEKQYLEDDAHIPNTRAYARGVFGAILASRDDLNQAGYEQWRWEKSKPGAIAYKRKYRTMRQAGASEADARREATKVFYRAVSIKSVTREGLNVICPVNGKEELLAWPLAVWRLKNGYLILSEKQWDRLKGILRQRGWGYKLQQAL